MINTSTILSNSVAAPPPNFSTAEMPPQMKTATAFTLRGTSDSFVYGGNQFMLNASDYIEAVPGYGQVNNGAVGTSLNGANFSGGANYTTNNVSDFIEKKSQASVDNTTMAMSAYNTTNSTTFLSTIPVLDGSFGATLVPVQQSWYGLNFNTAAILAVTFSAENETNPFFIVRQFVPMVISDYIMGGGVNSQAQTPSLTQYWS